MHVLALVSALMLVVLAVASPCAAQDADALRRELEQMRRQFERVQQDYQKAIEAMNDRLQRLETRPAPAPATAVAPASAPVTALMQAQPPAPGTTLGLTPQDLARPRQPFGLYGQRGTGQLLFDMGIAGDFIGNVTSRQADRSNLGTFAGRENRIVPRAVEVNLFGQIDPYARAEVRLEAGEEFANGERTTNFTLSEGHLTLLALPFGLQAKVGLMRNRFGLLNQIHEHDLPHVDLPDVLRNFFGEEGLVERGVEVTWVAPLPFYLELLGGLFNGDNETSFGAGSFRLPLVTGRARTFFELGDFGAIQLGASIANGVNNENVATRIVGVDAKYKLTPEGWLRPLFTLGGEALVSHRGVERRREIDLEVARLNGAPVFERQVETRTKTFDSLGWYVWADVQPFRRWLAGARYDRSQFPTTGGAEWAVEPYVAYLPSEFLRFRLAYKHTDRSNRDVFKLADADARILNEIFLQATFILGAHPAHPF